MKDIFKTCPNCKFEKCWYKAHVCEKCDYNFEERKRKRLEKRDDSIPTIKILKVEPKVLHKVCPACQYEKCWHAAFVCEKCDYDFVLGKKKKVNLAEYQEQILEIIKESGEYGILLEDITHHVFGYSSYDINTDVYIHVIQPNKEKGIIEVCNTRNYRIKITL